MTHAFVPWLLKSSQKEFEVQPSAKRFWWSTSCLILGSGSHPVPSSGLVLVQNQGAPSAASHQASDLVPPWLYKEQSLSAKEAKELSIDLPYQ